jgi:hypothetical protein
MAVNIELEAFVAMQVQEAIEQRLVALQTTRTAIARSTGGDYASSLNLAAIGALETARGALTEALYPDDVPVGAGESVEAWRG